MLSTKLFLASVLSLSISSCFQSTCAFQTLQHVVNNIAVGDSRVRRTQYPSPSSLAISFKEDHDQLLTQSSTTRKDFFNQVVEKSSIFATAILGTNFPTNSNIAWAAEKQAGQQQEKQYNLLPQAIAEIVSKDMTENSFLTNGQLTRSIYDEKATFTDEIDTYTLPQWIKGTSRLFVPPPKGSRVGLVGDVIATDEKVEFQFEEDLMFNIPFNPTVFVSGKVILERDVNSGLITSYREFWDQDVKTVLKSATFK